MSCIIGLIAYCGAYMHIAGPIDSGHPYRENMAWRYAAWYQPPILNAPTWAPVVTWRRG